MDLEIPGNGARPLESESVAIKHFCKPKTEEELELFGFDLILSHVYTQNIPN